MSRHPIEGAPVSDPRPIVLMWVIALGIGFWTVLLGWGIILVGAGMVGVKVDKDLWGSGASAYKHSMERSWQLRVFRLRGVLAAISGTLTLGLASYSCLSAAMVTFGDWRGVGAATLVSALTGAGCGGLSYRGAPALYRLHQRLVMEAQYDQLEQGALEVGWVERRARRRVKDWDVVEGLRGEVEGDLGTLLAVARAL